MRVPLDRYFRRLMFHAYAPLGWARAPNHVTLDITRRCNLKCKMCFYYGEGHGEIQSFSEMSSRQIIDRVVKKLDGVDYDITGGEPFVRNDILDILRAIKNNHAGCFVVTNGTLITKDIAQAIVREQLLNLVSFSIHGLEDTHDEITGVPGSFKRALRGIEILNSVRQQGDSKRPGMAIACSVNEHNIGNMSELLRLREIVGVDSINFNCCSYIPTKVRQRHEDVLLSLNLSCDKKYDDLVTGPPALDVSPNQVADFIGILKKRRSEGEVIITTPDGYDYQNMYDHFLNPDWIYRDSCRYPWRNLRVLPDGSVIPCIGFVVGNVVSDDVSKIWNNAKFRHFRSVLYEEKLFPGCFRCCKLK